MYKGKHYYYNIYQKDTNNCFILDISQYVSKNMKIIDILLYQMRKTL